MPQGLMNLARVFKPLAKDTDQVHGLFISVDPRRDSPDILREYVHYFSPNMTGLTGSDQQLAQVSRQYRAPFQRHDSQSEQYSIRWII